VSIINIPSTVRILLFLAAGYILLVIACALFQRKLLYFPTHHNHSNGLSEWQHSGQLIGYVRQASSPGTVWLFIHGNAGQAADRTYVLPSFLPTDAVFLLEYPGYGARPGSPSLTSFNAAAHQAYELLRRQYPGTPVCVAAESIGSGPASHLATLPNPPAKVVLITPFARLADVAAGNYPFLPINMLFRDKWDNISALQHYQGQIEIFAARLDTVIPLSQAKALANSKPDSVLHIVEGDHNDWSDSGNVRIRYEQEQ
jgi:pimeloyl-ACP methyl ester carboxylesterase